MGNRVDVLKSYLQRARKNGALIIHDRFAEKAGYQVVGEEKEHFFPKLDSEITSSRWPGEAFRFETKKILEKWTKTKDAPLAKRVWRLPEFDPPRDLPNYRQSSCAATGPETKFKKSHPHYYPGDLLVDFKTDLLRILKENGIKAIQFVGGDVFNCVLHRGIGIFAFYDGALKREDFLFIYANDLALPSTIRDVSIENVDKVINAYLMTHRVFITNSDQIEFKTKK